MVNEDIVTALRNAVNNGESLDSAVQIMINSGYDSKEVHEASQLIGSGVISNLGNLKNQIPQDSLFQQTSSDIYQSSPPSQMSQQPTTSQLKQYQSQQTQIQQPTQQTIQYNQRQPKKSYIKEIILVIILIILLGILGASIFFRERILGFFS